MTVRSCDGKDHLASDSEKFEHGKPEFKEDIGASDLKGGDDAEREELNLHRPRSDSAVEDKSVEGEMQEHYAENIEAVEEVHKKETMVEKHRFKGDPHLGVALDFEEVAHSHSAEHRHKHVENGEKEDKVPNNSVAGIRDQFDPSVLEHPPANKLSKRYNVGDNRVFIFGSAECDQFYINDDVFESRRPVEIPFFGQNRIKIIRISCGAQHTAVIDEEGKAYTWGNPDEGCLGRDVTDRSTVPALVELDEPVNLLSSGESHTICANSVTGSYFFWGTLKSALSGKLTTSPLPVKKSDYSIKRKGIAELKSGYNHIVILSGTKVYSWGDNDTGALGTVFRSGLAARDVNEPRALAIRNVTRIFTGGNHTFIIDKANRVFACGLNNYSQLGFEPSEDESRVLLPTQVIELNGKWIKDIRGGEHHTLILMNNGWVFGAGRNDDGQLGKLDPTVKLGGFTKLAHLPLVDRLWTSHHFNYAEDFERKGFYSWGMGFSYVLANGNEDTVEEAFPISNEKFFKNEYPSYLDLGHSHVVYTINELGSEKALEEKLRKHKQAYQRSRSKKTTKKVKQ